MTSLLVLGKNGQLGRALKRTSAVVYDAWGRETCDFTDSEHLLTLLDTARPRVLINAAAYTNVDGAEGDAATAFRVNAELPRVLAHWTGKHKAHLVHISTDYVFDGTKGTPYSEDDDPAPLNIYGESKLAGEDYVAASGASYTILRTSCLYDEDGVNFRNKILEQARRGTEISIPVVTDIIGSPTRADDFARALWALTSSYTIARGLFHLAGAKALSRFEWAGEILAEEEGTSTLAPISYHHAEGTALRPRNTSLSSRLIAEKCGICLTE
ncbi:MAG: dTDP-4-dehydrorhamnose reductase [Pseudobdellovibrionaceae bacterium]